MSGVADEPRMNADKICRLGAGFIGVYRRLFFLWLLCSSAAAQDLRTVTSPDGQIVFRAFVTPQGPGLIDRMAYQVLYRSKLLVETSFLGFEIRDQTLLGEKVGLAASETLTRSRYNSLVAEYLQNGSLGRRITLEIRTYNDGVAFRYIIPKSTPLDEILIENEDTEFRFAADAAALPRLLSGFEANPQQQSRTTLSQIPRDRVIAVPLVFEEPNVGWVEIAEVAGKGFPKLYLSHPEGTTLVTSLPPLPRDPHLALDASTPLTSSWRLLLIGETPEKVANSTLLDELNTSGGPEGSNRHALHRRPRPPALPGHSSGWRGFGSVGEIAGPRPSDPPVCPTPAIANPAGA